MHADTLNVLKLTLAGKVSAFGYPSAIVLLASTLVGNMCRRILLQLLLAIVSSHTRALLGVSSKLTTYKRPGNETSCNSNQGLLRGESKT